MKKFLTSLLLVLLCLTMVTLTACKKKEPISNDPDPTPAPTPAPQLTEEEESFLAVKNALTALKTYTGSYTVSGVNGEGDAYITTYNAETGEYLDEETWINTKKNTVYSVDHYVKEGDQWISHEYYNNGADDPENEAQYLNSYEAVYEKDDPADPIEGLLSIATYFDFENIAAFRTAAGKLAAASACESRGSMTNLSITAAIEAKKEDNKHIATVTLTESYTDSEKDAIKYVLSYVLTEQDGKIVSGVMSSTPYNNDVKGSAYESPVSISYTVDTALIAKYPLPATIDAASEIYAPNYLHPFKGSYADIYVGPTPIAIAKDVLRNYKFDDKVPCAFYTDEACTQIVDIDSLEITAESLKILNEERPYFIKPTSVPTGSAFVMYVRWYDYSQIDPDIVKLAGGLNTHRNYGYDTVTPGENVYFDSYYTDNVVVNGVTLEKTGEEVILTAEDGKSYVAVCAHVYTDVYDLFEN